MNIIRLTIQMNFGLVFFNLAYRFCSNNCLMHTIFFQDYLPMKLFVFFDRPLDTDNPYLDLEYRDLVRLFVNYSILPNRRMSKVTSLCSCRNTPNSRITLSQYIFSVVHAFSSLGRLFRFISRIVFTCKIRVGFFRNIDVVFFQRILPNDAQFSVSSYLSQSGYTSKSIFNIDIVSPLKFTSSFKHKHNAFRLQKFSSRIVLGLGPIDSFLEHYILRILPTYAVEHFHYYHSIAKRLSSPHIVCKCPTADEPLLRHIIAQKAHTSQLLITFQHGGGYGVYTSPHLDLEYTYSDIFFPWFKSKSGPAGSIVHPSMHEFVTSDNNTNKYSTDVLIIGTSLKSFFRYNSAFCLDLMIYISISSNNSYCCYLLLLFPQVPSVYIQF